VIELALADQRVLITEDTDFGALVYAHANKSSGVILLRFPARARRQLPAQLLQFLQQAGDNTRTAFVVLQPGRARVGRHFSADPPSP
jgi:predicted nuclease of predicted toxin-antitoxin system